MTAAQLLTQLRDLVQRDIGQRGLAREPHDNLLTATTGDFECACRAIAEHPAPRVGIVTGFMIPSATPPVGETDGPLGALFLAQTLEELGIPWVLASDAAAYGALARGIAFVGLQHGTLIELTPSCTAATFNSEAGPLTHLIALERSGPSHADGRNYTMRARDITALTAPAHCLFEGPRSYRTIGIGDGGNEIGMGKISRSTLAKNIPLGERVHCRTATDELIVAGISNWGAYALGAGCLVLRRHRAPALFDVARHQQLLADLVAHAPLVDGVSSMFTISVDGIDFATYADVFVQIGTMLANNCVS
jgi:hypothetical protein